MISHCYCNLLETTPILLGQSQVETQKEVGHHNHQVLMVLLHRRWVEEDPEINFKINLYIDYLLLDYKVFVDILQVVSYSVDIVVDIHQFEEVVFHHSPDSNLHQVEAVGNPLQEVHPTYMKLLLD